MQKLRRVAIVVGGAGTIGDAVVRRLLDEDVSVAVFDLKADVAPGSIPSGSRAG